ncbi:MAG TPA: twin-arginine translocation signal domain-containing protein [Blastocatellia bacterium]|jgi:phosphotriesterase-related protein|nr:twin-arginine translocation signal domain-containing protein [Blastocatellia bacterium]
MRFTKSRSNEDGGAVDLSRRSFLKQSSLLVVAASVGGRIAMLPGISGGADFVPWQTGSRPRTPAFPKGAVIRSLLKDVPPAALSSGAVLFHEHLSLHYPLTNALAAKQGVPPPTNFSDDVDLMIAETRAAGVDGVSCIVDGGHPDMDRSLAALKRIAAASGVHIVASGGYYMQRNYPPEIAAKSADQIADDLVREAGTERLGAFGEIGQQDGELTADERKVFTAVGKAHVRTGLPIFTHNAYTGTRVVNPPVPREAALRQLEVLEAAGAKPQKIAIGHVCCLDDPTAEVAKQVARRGAFVGFDRVTIQILPDSKRVKMILALLDAGYAENLLLSSDFSSPRALKKNGGAGLAQTVTVFGKLLLEAGVKQETLHSILVDNPRRFLGFVPRR